MKFLFAAAAVLSLAVLAVLGHSHHGQEAVSYSVITKHEDHHAHDHGHHHHHEQHNHDNGHKEHHENYVNHEHQVHHGHHEHHVHHEHHSQHGHHVEHHGNNGHDNHHGHHDHHNEKHSHAKYDFKYGVKDPKTGDVKQQWESRDGDKVKGSYSLKEADGTTRVVNYSSDKKKGFEATVHKIGHAHHEHHGHHHSH